MIHTDKSNFTSFEAWYYYITLEKGPYRSMLNVKFEFSDIPKAYCILFHVSYLRKLSSFFIQYDSRKNQVVLP